MNRSHAEGVSDNGVVVGWTWGPSTGSQPFYWTVASGSRLLPLPPSATGGSAWGVSSDGRFIAGVVAINGQTEPVRWSIFLGIATVSVLHRCGATQPVTIANDVNVTGVVVGAVDMKGVTWASPSYCPVPIVAITDTVFEGVANNDIGSVLGEMRYTPHDYLISKCFAGSCFSIIRPLAGHVALNVTDVNDANVVVGVSYGVNFANPRPVTWALATGAVAVSGGAASGFVGISAKGRVVWWDPTSASPQGRTKLGTKVYSLALEPFGVNACGDIAGDENHRAVFYRKYGSCD